jgi:UDP-glucose 4-epimerase
MNKTKTFIVTGCAGFIGSNMVDRLLLEGFNVIGIDNFITGRREFLKNALLDSNFKLLELDLLSNEFSSYIFSDVEAVFHFAANADVRFGINHPRKDLEQNTIVSFNVLESMRKSRINKIIFSSTGSVYGESSVIPTPEDAPFPIQTSLYGASKVACEGLISAYCGGFGFQSWIFRFVSILGERYTHGHIYDFYQKLKIEPTVMTVLGNGRQRKSYLYIQDCIDAIMLSVNKTNEKINIFNLGVDGYIEVNKSIDLICRELGFKPRLEYSGGDRGWIGDNPLIYLDTKKIQSIGWMPKFNIEQGVIQTVKYLKNNEWVFEKRGGM